MNRSSWLQQRGTPGASSTVASSQYLHSDHAIISVNHLAILYNAPLITRSCPKCPSQSDAPVPATNDGAGRSLLLHWLNIDPGSN